MSPKQYMSIQLKMIGVARQVNAIDGLPEFLELAAKMPLPKEDEPTDPLYIEAKMGLTLVRDLAEIFLEVRKRTTALDDFFNASEERARGRNKS